LSCFGVSAVMVKPAATAKDYKRIAKGRHKLRHGSQFLT
jgi:hypothetical protein